MRTLQNDINTSSEKFGFVEYFEGSLRDGESKKAADSIIPENLQNLDPRRQKIIPVNSYFATYAELPPTPSVEPKLMEDFAMDLQQIASEQISRIDAENNILLQKHEEYSEETIINENESTESSNDVENDNFAETPSECTEYTEADDEESIEDSVQDSTGEEIDENTVEDDSETADDESGEDKKEGED